ncbi:MAG: tRNA 2-thiocytidine(32) synthetase TtcA, partial [Leisingera sp.]
LMNARPSHLLDPKLFDFAGLELKSDDSGPEISGIPKLR